ncbi:carboxylesterase family protein [Klebsiella pneumoniae]|nr:carboxylesterase family protein [Klebsiella pneumoniae]
MQHPSKPLAKTRQGTLAGSAEQGIHIWRGIPYAAPPVGPLRWRAPQPAARWQGVRPAETFSAASWQDIDYCRELGGGDPGAFSEDCLYLNVWAPASAAQPLPAGRTLTTAASSAAAILAPSAKTAYISTSGPRPAQRSRCR